MLSDEDLFHEWQRGSAAALEVLVQRYYTPLLAHLYRLMQDVQSAEDIAQETFVCLVQLLTILSYAAVALLALLGASLRTIGTPYFSPPLGPGVVTLIWLMLVPVPLIFVCALTLFGISLLRGKRAFIFVLVLLIWIAPLALVDRISDVFNLPTPSLLILPPSPQAPSNSLLRLDAAKRLYIEKLSNDGVLHFTPADWKELTHLYQSTVIPEHMTTTFLLNRGLFLALSILLFIGTISILKLQRQDRL